MVQCICGTEWVYSDVIRVFKKQFQDIVICVDDVAVIDEAQMIQNNERGFAWTRVILGIITNCYYYLIVCVSPPQDFLLKRYMCVVQLLHWIL